jgi:hypothetical protein
MESRNKENSLTASNKAAGVSGGVLREVGLHSHTHTPTRAPIPAPVKKSRPSLSTSNSTSNSNSNSLSSSSSSSKCNDKQIKVQLIGKNCACTCNNMYHVHTEAVLI